MTGQNVRKICSLVCQLAASLIIPQMVFSYRGLHFGLSLILKPRSFYRKALYADHQQGNIIIAKMEAGTTKSFHFNLEIEDESVSYELSQSVSFRSLCITVNGIKITNTGPRRTSRVL